MALAAGARILMREIYWILFYYFMKNLFPQISYLRAVSFTHNFVPSIPFFLNEI